MKYFALTDNENKDVVIKSEETKSLEAVLGVKRKWRYKGMLSYFNEDSPKYGKYEEITPKEAQLLIKHQNRQLDIILKELDNDFKDNKIRESLEENFDKEQIAVYMFFMLGKDYVGSHQNLISRLPRLECSVDCLFTHLNRLTESDLLELRVHRNTRLIAIDYYKHQFVNQKISEATYNTINDFLLQKTDKADFQSNCNTQYLSE